MSNMFTDYIVISELVIYLLLERQFLHKFLQVMVACVLFVTSEPDINLYELNPAFAEPLETTFKKENN